MFFFWYGTVSIVTKFKSRISSFLTPSRFLNIFRCTRKTSSIFKQNKTLSEFEIFQDTQWSQLTTIISNGQEKYEISVNGSLDVFFCSLLGITNNYRIEMVD